MAIIIFIGIGGFRNPIVLRLQRYLISLEWAVSVAPLDYGWFRKQKCTRIMSRANNSDTTVFSKSVPLSTVIILGIPGCEKK